MTYRTHALRCRGPEGKFSQAHLHCFLCSSCVRSLCCLNTMGGSRKLQHLSDRHSIIVTRRAMTTNAANANHRNAHLFLIYAIFFPLVPSLCKCLKKKILKLFPFIWVLLNSCLLWPPVFRRVTHLDYTHFWNTCGLWDHVTRLRVLQHLPTFPVFRLSVWHQKQFTTRKQANKGQGCVLGLDVGIIYILS